jgi:hypothetical protein
MTRITLAIHEHVLLTYTSSAYGGADLEGRPEDETEAADAAEVTSYQGAHILPPCEVPGSPS